MFWREMMRQLRRDEGYDDKPYRDSEGWLTIGIGHLIDPRKGASLYPVDQKELDDNGSLSQATIERIFQDDVMGKHNELIVALPWATGLTEPRYGCLLNMSFQMGVTGLLGFKNTLAMIKSGDYDGAASGMLNSKWASQTPNRAKRVSEQMRTNKWN